jgi:hypothetical protein
MRRGPAWRQLSGLPSSSASLLLQSCRGFYGAAAFAVPLTGDLAATALVGRNGRFYRRCRLAALADAAGVFAGFFIAFAIESTAN